jgi:replicative DNA helicase
VEVSEISRGIKALALELNVPIIVLSQLNRRPEDSMAEPALHHLRESGSIEQDADVVMLLNRVETKEGEIETVQHGRGFATRCKLNIAKQRNGPTDKIDLLFRGECTLFESIPRMAK